MIEKTSKLKVRSPWNTSCPCWSISGVQVMVNKRELGNSLQILWYIRACSLYLHESVINKGISGWLRDGLISVVNDNPTEQNRFRWLWNMTLRWVPQSRNKNLKWQETERFRDKCHVSTAWWLSSVRLGWDVFLLLHLYLPGEWGEMPLGAPRSTLCSVAFKVFIISDPLIGY